MLCIHATDWNLLSKSTGWVLVMIGLLVGGRDASDAAAATAVQGLEGPARLVNEADHAWKRRSLPPVDDDEIQGILESQELIFYSEAEIPRAYAKWNGSLAGVHSPAYNISAGAGEPFGNGNREFPWSTGGGTHRASHLTTVHFLWLPKDAAGQRLPVVYETSPATASGLGKVSWRFPHGAVLGECLLITFTDGSLLPCELRVRKRVESDWEVDVFRPFPTARSLADRVQQIRPSWAADPSLANLIDHLHDPNRMVRATLRDQHPRRTFDQVAGVDSLPYMEPTLVQDLLKTTIFQSCLDTVWKKNDEGLECHAPTTEFAEQLVPHHYDGGFIRVNSQSCLRCHATVGTNVAEFDARRDWYGVIRGSDGIFSFHPFDRASISYNGMSTPVRVNQSMIHQGILAPFDPEHHTSDWYSTFQP